MTLDKSLSGKRLKLINTNDKFTELKSGDLGTIEFILRHSDQTICEDQICIKWDNGSNLMLLVGVDQFHILGDQDE